MQLESSDSNEFIRSVLLCLESKNFTVAAEILTDDGNAGYLRNQCWDLIPILCEKLNDKDSHAGCKEILEILAGKADPEEAVLEFLERIEEACSSQFPVLLTLLKSLLCRVVTNRKNLLEWCLNSIRSYLERISSSENDKATEHSVKNSVECTLTFIEHFVAYFINDKAAVEKEPIKLLLASRLIQLCDMLLPFVSWGSSDEVAVRTLYSVLKLMPDPCILLKYIINRSVKINNSGDMVFSSKLKDLRDVEDNDFKCVLEPPFFFEDESVISNLSYGIFFYILLSKAEIPLVYNSKFIFLSLAHVVVPFLENPADVTVRKGLHFLDFLLNQLHELLGQRDLCFEIHCKLLVQLNNVMIYSERKEFRTGALKCFRSYVFSFDWEARYWLLFYFRNHVRHPGTLGYLITVLKEFMLQFTSLPAESETVKKFCKYYKGKLLFDIMKKYCFLTEGFSTDLVEYGDQVISSLNFIRFLILKDRYNVTNIKCFIGQIEEDFLKPLTECVSEAKNHYNARLKNFNEKESDYSPVIQVAVKNFPLPNLTKEQERTACISSLNALHLIDSLLIRISELIDEFHS